MLVLSSPSGAGKTTLSRRLLDDDGGCRAVGVGDDARAAAAARSMAATITSSIATRFDAMARSGELLEWAEVFGNCYGTPREPVEAALAQGRDVLFDIDWQGTQQLRDKVRSDLVSVFVLPPSVKSSNARLHTPRAGHRRDHPRPYDEGGGRDEPLGRIRLRRRQHRSRCRRFANVRAILAAERNRRHRQVGLSDFVRGLQADI